MGGQDPKKKVLTEYYYIFTYSQCLDYLSNQMHSNPFQMTKHIHQIWQINKKCSNDTASSQGVSLILEKCCVIWNPVDISDMTHFGQFGSCAMLTLLFIRSLLEWVWVNQNGSYTKMVNFNSAQHCEKSFSHAILASVKHV